jgi:vitamin B12 transporter
MRKNRDPGSIVIIVPGFLFRDKATPGADGMKRFIGVCLCSSLLALPSYAQAEPPRSDQDRLSEVVVTASRSAESVDETLAAVTIITRRDIEQNQYRSVPEALSQVPGLQLSRSGSIGQLADVYLRGTDSNHTVVLINGIRIGSATNSRASLQHIPVSQIERIEVVRGPRSTLYGSDAIGGVIHIFTRKGSEEQQGQVSLEGGSLGSYDVQAAISGALGKSYYSLAGSLLETEGFDVMENGVTDPWGWPTANEPDKDGYLERSASVRLGHRFSPGNEVELYAMHSAGTTEYDGDFQNETDFLQQIMGVTAKIQPFALWDVTLLAGQSRDDAENLKNGFFASYFDTTRSQMSWQNDLFMGEHHILTAGIDYYQDKLSSDTKFARDSRDTAGTYLQYQFDADRHSLQIGWRYEDNEQFGGHTTYNLSYGYRLPYDLRVVLNYGTAFRAPTFNELYWPTSGNPYLNPEESESYEASIQQQLDWGQWRLGIFRTDIDDLISGWPAENINRARIDGLEIETTINLDDTWQARIILSLIDPKDRYTDLLLPRRAKETLAFDLDGTFGMWRLGMSLQAAGSRYDDALNTTEVSGYGIMSLRASYALSEQWLLQGKINNLFDQRYTEVATYRTEGRVAFVTLTYTF